MANKLQEISKRLKQLDRQWDRMPEADRRSSKSDPLRAEMGKMREEADKVIGNPALPEGFKYGFASPVEGTVRYAVHILPSTHIPVKAWGKIVKIDDNLKKNLAKYGVEFYGEFIQKIGAPPLVRYAGRREFIVAKKGLEPQFNKWHKNGHTKARARPEPKPSTQVKEPWKMTANDYIGTRAETGSSRMAKAMFGKPYFQASPDKSYVIGERFKDYRGQTWQIVGQNDLHVPYVAKVVGGKPQKKQYVGHERDMHKAGVAKALREGKPVPAEVLKDYPELGKAAAARLTKLTDQLDALPGIEKTYWKGDTSTLTVYYDETTSKDAANVRIQKYLTDKRLHDSVEKITFISTGKGTFKPELKAEGKGKEPEWAERHIYSGYRDEFGHLPTYKTKGQAEKAAKGFEKRWGFYETQVYERYPGVWGFKYRKSPETLAKEKAETKPKKEIAALKAKPSVKQSDRAIAIDRALLAKQVVPINDPRWLKRPNRFDVRGVDTPGSRKVVAGVAYADKGKKRLSRRHHRGFRKIKFT